VTCIMPVKKAKAKKLGSTAETEAPESAELKDLKAQAEKLHTLTKKEEHDFNEFQQQREKLNYFWVLEKKKLEDIRAELRNKNREQEDLEEKQRLEVKTYKQRLKHLLHEHQHDITLKKTEAEVALKMAQDDNREQNSEIKHERRDLDTALKEIELNHDQFIRGLKLEQDKKITFLRHEFERKANEVQKLYEVSCNSLSYLEYRESDYVHTVTSAILRFTFLLTAIHEENKRWIGQKKKR
jgi:growth arrest-specific protein 8